jgi:ATP-binding cassette subfamily C (CFTR/MRP) protein 1
VTHQVHLLDRCDRILALSNGSVLAFGTPEEVKIQVDLNALAAPPAEMQGPLESRGRSQSSSTVGDSVDETARVSVRRENDTIDTQDVVNNFASAAEAYLTDLGDGEKDSVVTSIIREIAAEDRINVSRSASAASISGANEAAPVSLLEVELQEASGEAVQKQVDAPKADGSCAVVSLDDAIADVEQQEHPKSGALITTEERQRGQVTWEAWKWYVGKGGWIWFILCVIIALGGSASSQYSSFWLAEWGDESVASYYRTGKPMSDKKTIYYLNQYALLSIMGLASAVLRTLVMVTFGLNASRKLHRRMLASVFSSPVSFFDSTPLGRLLNRFSSDVTTCDDTLASNIAFIMGIITNVFGALGSIAYTTKGVFVAVAAPLIYGYYRAQLYFRLTNTELKRLENISRSPIYTDFNQALIGASSLRAYGELDRFAGKLNTAVDLNSSVQIAQQLVRWWLLIRLDFIGGIVSFFVAALCAGDPTYISPSYLSISLNCAFSLVGFLKRFVSISADLEASMNSAERIKFYSDTLVSEETPELRENYKPVTEKWPEDGRIDAKNVSMRYKTGPLVLKGLDFSIDGNEKIGIAGRTGCGKSSLMASLFRIENLEEGSIRIDDVDISTVPLSALRSRIGIIPQDAVMFSVTVRFNLDPFNNYTDDEIWSVLDAVEMKEVVMSFPGKLEEPVSDGGENFSMGQRQLLCIARVLLRKPKVLVMDEATASVDNETDGLIQRMIREKFKDCTVLTIAHRLHTVIDSDRIMLLSEGNLVEFDSPQRLLEQPDGLFASLWNEHVKSHEIADKK